MKVTVYNQDGSSYQATSAPLPPAEKPIPLPEKPEGYELLEGEKLLWERFSGYYKNLKFSFDTNRWRPLIDGFIQPNGLVTARLDLHPEWLNYWVETITEYIAWVAVQPGAGMCDGDSPNTDLWHDEIKFNPISSGSNRWLFDQWVTAKSGAPYALIKTLSLYNDPDTTMNYDNHPEYMMHMVCSIRNQDKRITPPGGNINVPFVTTTRVGLEKSKVVFYPEHSNGGFQCNYMKWPVTVDGYIISGSKTFVHIKDGELQSGWYQADGHHVEDFVEPMPGKSEYYFSNISHCSKDDQSLPWPGETPVITTWTKSGNREFYAGTAGLWLPVSYPFYSFARNVPLVSTKFALDMQPANLISAL